MGSRTRSRPAPSCRRSTWGRSSCERVMLEVADLHTYYGDRYVLQGVSLTVSRGQVVAVPRPNRVGKLNLTTANLRFTRPGRRPAGFKGPRGTRRAADL